MNTRERLAFIEEYREWREDQELLGKPSDLDAYEEWVREREPMEVLERITALYGQLETDPTSEDVRAFGWEVIRLLPTANRKEIAAS